MRDPSVLLSFTAMACALALGACGGNGIDPDAADEHVIPNGSTATVVLKGAAGPSVRESLFLDDADESHPEYGNSDRAESLRQILECAKDMGVDKSRVKVVGSNRMLDLFADEILFVKVRENNTSATVNIESEADGAEIRGVCVFVHGNRATVGINHAAKVGKIYYRAKGNKSRTIFTVKAPAVLGSANVNVEGDKPSLVVSGVGAETCGTLMGAVTGHKDAFSCN